MIQILFFLSLLLSAFSQCTTGFYSDSGVCSPCDPSCAECTGPNPSQCSSCFTDMTMTANTCNCPALKYFNPSKKGCDSCHSSCSSCDGPTSINCLNCTLPSKYYQGKCLNCPYNSYVNSTGSCKACDISCNDCSDSSATGCTDCRNNMVLVSGQCQCPAGSFLHTTTYTCLPCYSACETCSGPLESQCLSCPSGLSLYKTACLCPTGTYYDVTMGSCVDCHASCKECSGPESFQCKACDDGTYLRSGSCNSCSPACLTCSGGTSKDCTSCPTGKIMFNGQCLSQNGCHETCTQCIGPNPDQCIFCKSPLLFIQGDLAGTCVESCPSTSYVKTENGRQECKSKTVLRGSLSLGTELNTYKIAFNMDISSYYRGLIDIMSLDISLQPKQGAISFTKTFSLGSNNKAIFISFSFDHDLLPSNFLLVQFNNSKNAAGSSYFMQDTLLQIEMQESTNYPKSIQNMINAVSKINTAGSQGNGAFSISSAFVLKSIHSLRSHFMESMIGYLVFLNVYYPPNFIKYATDMTNNDDDFSPNFFNNVAEAIENEVEQEKINQNSESSGRLLSNAIAPYHERYNGLVPSQVFISNLGAELTVFIIAVMCLVTVEITLKLIPDKYHKTKLYDFVLDTSRSFRYNFILNQILSTYNDFAMYGSMDVINITDFRAAYGVYFLMAPCALILAFSGPFIFYYFIRWFFAKLAEYNRATDKESHPDYDTIKRFKLMIKPFKKNRMVYLLYHPLLMIRSLIFAISVVFAQNSPAFQVVINPLMSLGVLFYLLKWRPFKLRIQLFLSVIYEIFYLIAAMAVLMLHFYTVNHMEDVQTRGNLAFVIIACSILMMAMDFISIFFEISEMIRVYKKKKAARKVVPALVKKLTPPGGLQSPTSQPMLSFNQNTMQASINNEKLLSDDASDTQNDLSSFNDQNGSTPVKTLAKKNSTFRSYVLNSLTLPGLVKSRKSSIWPADMSSNPMSPAESDHELSLHNQALDKGNTNNNELIENEPPGKGEKNNE